MSQVSDVILYFSNDITLLNNYYSESEEVRHRFADELRRGFLEKTDENRTVLSIKLKDCADLGDLLRTVYQNMVKEENSPPEDLPLSIWQRTIRTLDRRMEREGKHICLLIEEFHLCRVWDDTDFSWFREFLYHSDVFSCITVSESHLERFAHRPPFGSPLSNIFTVVERISEELYE